MGKKKLLVPRFVTDKKPEDFHSELPRSIAVLSAVRKYSHSVVVQTVWFHLLEDRLHYP
jgi:hypothetical protein